MTSAAEYAAEFVDIHRECACGECAYCAGLEAAAEAGLEPGGILCRAADAAGGSSSDGLLRPAAHGRVMKEPTIAGLAADIEDLGGDYDDLAREVGEIKLQLSRILDRPGRHYRRSAGGCHDDNAKESIPADRVFLDTRSNDDDDDSPRIIRDTRGFIAGEMPGTRADTAIRAMFGTDAAVPAALAFAAAHPDMPEEARVHVMRTVEWLRGAGRG